MNDMAIEALEELKEARKGSNENRKAGYKHGYSDGYNKAIDEFVNAIKTSQDSHLWCCSDHHLEYCNGDNCDECLSDFGKQIDKIAEQLKAGDS